MDLQAKIFESMKEGFLEITGKPSLFYHLMILYRAFLNSKQVLLILDQDGRLSLAACD
jgi:hypothetical protein